MSLKIVSLRVGGSCDRYSMVLLGTPYDPDMQFIIMALVIYAYLPSGPNHTHTPRGHGQQCVRNCQDNVNVNSWCEQSGSMSFILYHD